MSKAFSLLLLSLMAVLIFTGCTQPEPIEKPISEVETEIKQAYLEAFPGISSHSNISDLSIRFIGEFGNTYAVFVDIYGTLYTEEITHDVVNDLVFTYPNSQKMFIYHKGNFYSLPEAYDRRILSNDEWKELHTNYANR